MDKQAVIRRVRIAVSVFFGLLTLALCVLWVRSYWWAQMVIDRVPLVGGVSVRSSQGGIDFRAFPFHSNKSVDERLPIYRTIRVLSQQELAKIMRSGSFAPEYCGFAFRVESIGDWRVATPYWFLVLVSTTIAAMNAHPLFAWRFSLRTMLIATTLVAVVLGLGVWLVR